MVVCHGSLSKQITYISIWGSVLTYCGVDGGSQGMVLRRAELVSAVCLLQYKLTGPAPDPLRQNDREPRKLF